MFSYAGLHCVVIKGYSKSAGYQPGVKFEDNRVRNSWNAVYVAGAWRFVQCNWGARCHSLPAYAACKPCTSSSLSSKGALLNDQGSDSFCRRHLVNAKEVPKPGKAKSDSLR